MSDYVLFMRKYRCHPIDDPRRYVLSRHFGDNSAVQSKLPNPRLYPLPSALDSGMRRNDGRYRNLESVGTGRDLSCKGTTTGGCPYGFVRFLGFPLGTHTCVPYPLAVQTTGRMYATPTGNPPPLPHRTKGRYHARKNRDGFATRDFSLPVRSGSAAGRNYP